MRITYLDYETYSECNIKKSGAYRYAQHPSTIVLCLSYAVDNGSIQRWFPGDAFPFKRGTFVAHNSEFEYLIWMYVCTRLYDWRTPPPRKNWIDTAAVSRYHGLPGSLDGCSKALHLRYKKDGTGHRIMMKLSRPRKPTAANPDTRWTPETKPEDFEKLYDYCDQDVIVERAIHHKLANLPKIEQKIWEQNCRINDLGIPVDAELARTVLQIREDFVTRANARIEKLTGGVVTRATQTARLTEYLGVDSLAKDTLNQRIKEDYTEKQNELIELRLSAAQSSTAKFEALLAAVCEDGRLHGLFMYHAANQTGRYGGSLIQPHNLPRPTIENADVEKVIKLLHSDISIKKKSQKLHKQFPDVMAVLKSLIRGSLYAGEDHTFVVSDFASVEARKLAWVSGCERLINLFAAGGNPYLDMAKSLFGRTIHKEKDHHEYFISKQLILGAGYSMSGSRFMNECYSKGVDVTREFADQAIKSYRKTYPEIPQLWYTVNKAALQAIKSRKPQFAARCMFVFKTKPFERLVIVLPSGREMSYPYASVRWIWPPWESEEKIEQMHYWTIEQKTYHWVQTHTYGGSLVENICQASCRDVLASRMLLMDRHNLPVVIHVHDEAGVLVKDVNVKKAQKLVSNIMSSPPPWAVGLPLGQEGYTAKRYRK